MKIYFNNSYIEIQPDDNAYRSRQIMGEDALYLSFDYQGYLDIPVGAYCEFDGVTYYLLKPQNFKKNGTRKFAYDLLLESDAARLKLYRFKNTVDGRLKFEEAARPEEYLAQIVANMNLRSSGWTVGDCIEAKEKLLSFNHNTVAEVLDQVASEFETEWSIDGKVISLKKLKKESLSPLALSYGKGNGFLPGLGRSNYDNSRAFEILFVQGGERNIDYSKYGNKTLLLPKSQTLSFDGEHFEDEVGFDSSKARQYITDANGISIRRNDRILSALAVEDSFDCEECYPKRVGKVSSWIVVDADNNLYDFTDSSIPAALNYMNQLIEGETMTVIFQTGMLAGREFEIQKYDPATKRFEIVPAEIDGQTMPNSTFKAAVNDEYAIFGCTLPDAYICDNQTKTGASWEMFKLAVRYMWENEEPRFSFEGVLDGQWAASNWSTISAKIILGGLVSFSDDQFLLTPELVRIIGIKQYLNKPKYPELKLSNGTVTPTIATELNEYKAEEVSRDNKFQESIQYTKRRWRDLKETQEMLAAALENYSEAINPIAVQTMQMIVGDESLQFRFVTSKIAPITVDGNFAIAFNAQNKRLVIAGGLTQGASILQHMTLGIDTLSSTHGAAEYKFWDIPAFISDELLDATKKYYVYAKCSKSNQTGTFILSETPIQMEGVNGYYHFLLGILNTEFDNTRSFAQTYGYTEVLPGRITTDRIVSADGINFFDLLTGELNMSLANGSQFIKFDENGVHIKGKLTIGAGSSGLAQFDEYPELIAEIENRTPWNIILTNQNASVACRNDGTVIGSLPTSGVRIFYGGSLQSGWSYSLVCTGCTATVVGGVITVTSLTADNATVEVTATKDGCPTMKTTMNIVKVRGGGSGVGVQSIVEQYYLSDSPTSQTGGSWGETVPAWVDGKYMWTRSVITYTDSSSVTTDPICVTGGKGATGQAGQDGDDGIGISDVDVEYYLSNSSSELIGGEWSTTAPTWVNGRYMWSRTHTTYTDGNETYSDPCCITGSKGEQGIQGPAGQDGRTTYFHVKYSPVANPTASQMTETPSDYIGTYVDYNQVDSSDPSDYTWSRFKGIDGKDGDQGIPGKDGEDGTTYYLHIAYANSQDGTVDFSTSVSEGKTYIGQYVDTNSDDSTNPSDYSWSKIKGEDAVIYFVQPSVSVVKRTWGGDIIPSSLTCKKYKIVGNSAAVETTEKTLMYSVDGGAQQSYSGAIAINAGTEYVDFNLYDGTTLLDTQRVLVLNDASEFDVEGFENEIDALKARADAVQGTLEKMNSDRVFDIDEKSYIRTLWENINGLPSLEEIGSTGSYASTVSLLQQSGYLDNGERVVLSFNGKILLFNGGQDKLVFKKSGIGNLDAAFSNLRAYLTEMQLYSGEMTEGYDKEFMNSLFTAYYDAQEVLLSKAHFHYANEAAQSSVQSFINGQYASDLAAVKASVDKKAETFVQATNPATAWTDDDTKQEHVGDIWWNNGDSEVAGVSAGSTAVYRYNQTTSTYYWEVTPVPEEIFDRVDGKNAIFAAIPNTAGTDGYCYHENDLWILESGLTSDLIPADAQVGDILIANADSTSYNKAHWKKKVRYTDDTAFNNWVANTYAPFVTEIKASVDGKAESYSQPTNPATAWDTPEKKAAHKGDIWLNTSAATIAGVEAGQSAIWDGSSWGVSAVPKAVFDEIDGKAAIYVTWNAWGNDLREKDIFIPAATTTQGSVTYKANKMYRCTNTNPVTFQEIDYTDDTALTNFINGAYKTAIESLKTQIDGKAETYVQSSDPAAAWTTPELKEEHVGDMWLNTSATAVSGIASKKTAIYTKTGTTYAWSQQNVPNQLFDIYDGKATVYVTLPSSYKAKDMWIIGDEVAAANIPAGCTVGDLVIATTDSTSFNKAHWAKKVKYTDDSALNDFKVIYEQTVTELKDSIASTQAAIERMNSDTVLDESEKSYIRTEWERIQGKPNTGSASSDRGASGSYESTLALIAGWGYTEGDSVTLSFGGKTLVFNSKKLVFKYRGIGNFTAAYNALRQYLSDMALYESSSTVGFERTVMSQLFTNYYEAQATLLNNAQYSKVRDIDTMLDMWADDDYISPSEKRSLVTLLKDETEVYNQLRAKGDLYKNQSGTASEKAVYTAWNTYISAFYAFQGALNYYTNESRWNESIAIVKTEGQPYSWAYVTGYYEKRTALEEAIDNIIKEQSDDYAYLKAALPSGATTDIGEGVVLSQVIGVKADNSTSVVAGMNGSASVSALNDSSKGKLMIWAGASNLSVAKTAPFRVWETGEIYAVSGIIGGLTIKEDGLYYYPNGNQQSNPTFYVTGRAAYITNAQISGAIQTRCSGSGTTNYLSLAQANGKPLIRINSSWLSASAYATYLYRTSGTTIVNTSAGGWWSTLNVNAYYDLLDQVVPTTGNGTFHIPGFSIGYYFEGVTTLFKVEVLLLRWTSSSNYVVEATIASRSNINSGSGSITISNYSKSGLSSYYSYSVVVHVTGAVQSSLGDTSRVQLTVDADAYGYISYSSGELVKGLFFGANGMDITFGTYQRFQYIARSQSGSYFSGFSDGNIVNDYRDNGGQFEVSLNNGSSDSVGIRIQGYYDAAGSYNTNANSIRINFGDGNGWRKVKVSNNYLMLE